MFANNLWPILQQLHIYQQTPSPTPANNSRIQSSRPIRILGIETEMNDKY